MNCVYRSVLERMRMLYSFNNIYALLQTVINVLSLVASLCLSLPHCNYLQFEMQCALLHTFVVLFRGLCNMKLSCESSFARRHRHLVGKVYFILLCEGRCAEKRDSVVTFCFYTFNPHFAKSWLCHITLHLIGLSSNWVISGGCLNEIYILTLPLMEVAKWRHNLHK